MKLALPERLRDSLYDPEDGPYDFKALMPRMVATMLIGAPMMLVWALVFLYFFSERGAFIGFARSAIFDLALLALISVRRMSAASMRDVYLSVHQAATFFVVLSLGGISGSAGITIFALMAPSR